MRGLSRIARPARKGQVSGRKASSYKEPAATRELDAAVAIMERGAYRIESVPPGLVPSLRGLIVAHRRTCGHFIQSVTVKPTPDGSEWSVLFEHPGHPDCYRYGQIK